jgi:DNA-binding transcriptional ArsR family regulator
MQMTDATILDMVAVAKALGDQTRARIVGMLGVRSVCVCELKAALSLSQATVSDHLRILVEAGLVTASRRSYWTLYAMREDLPSESLQFVSLLTDQVHTQFPNDRSRLACTPVFACAISSNPAPVGRHRAGQLPRKFRAQQ